jgi:hypothetical protein
VPTETEHEQRGIDRRQLLKRAAAAGIVVWTVPAVQTLNMPAALAQVGSPGETCYTITILSNAHCSSPGANENVANTLKCLYAFDPDLILRNTGAGCQFATLTSTDIDGHGTWLVQLAPGCSLVAGFARSGTGSGACIPASDAGGNPLPNGSTGSLYFPGQPVNHVEITFCCKP